MILLNLDFSDKWSDLAGFMLYKPRFYNLNYIAILSNYRFEILNLEEMRYANKRFFKI